MDGNMLEKMMGSSIFENEDEIKSDLNELSMVYQIFLNKSTYTDGDKLSLPMPVEISRTEPLEVQETKLLKFMKLYTYFITLMSYKESDGNCTVDLINNINRLLECREYKVVNYYWIIETSRDGINI